MYQAERVRRTSMLYVPEQDLHSLDRTALIEDLREAIERGQLRLYYQPIVEIASGEVTAVEALVRWAHPQRGLLYPDTFLPLLDYAGLQRALTRWVLGLRQQRDWRLHDMELKMKINLAASDLQDDTLLADISRQLSARDHQGRLCLELTEGALQADLAHTREILLQLAAAGALISIDDYGTGFSSLSRLARFPVDELKIDRLFVQTMVQNPVDLAIVASTIGLAHSIGVPVVAEGVEDEATLQHLQELGCDLVQGYYYSRPLPPEHLERWLVARNTPLP